MEEQLLLWFREHAHPLLDALFATSHYAGGASFCVPLVLSMAAWHVYRGERRCGVTWLGLGAAVYVLQVGLKWVFGRSRPELWLDGRWAVSPGSYAFPSGHALAAAVVFPFVAVSLSAAYPRFRLLWWVCAATLTAWVGVGRLYLGVHWPSDVLAGWLVGLSLVALGARCCRASDPETPGG